MIVSAQANDSITREMHAGWVNRHQLDVIDYLQEENRVLKERLGGRRIRFTDTERRRLARKAYALGRKILTELLSISFCAWRWKIPRGNTRESAAHSPIWDIRSD